MMKFFLLQILFVVALAVLPPLCAQNAQGEAQSQGEKTEQASAPLVPRDQAQPTQEENGKNENLDIVFLIDSSKSMTWTDPQGLRKAAVKAFLDITQDRGGDRIAVLQFAGWNETESQGATVFPLTEMPSDEREREKVIGQAKEAVATKITPFGNATDFNCAFQKCVLDIIQKRKEENAANNLWVILLTDGEMDVVEEPAVRQEYKERAARMGQKISRETLNKAATEIFETEVLPLLSSEKNLFITCINLSSTEADLLKTISAKTRSALISSTRERLKGIFVEALAALPGNFYREGLSRGFSYTSGEVQPAAKFSDTFHIYEGAKTMHLVVFASNPSFSVDILNADNSSIIQHPEVRIAGEGEIYRAITLKNFRFGDYTIVCTNNSESASLFEKLIFTRFELDSYVDVSKVLEKYLPGEEILLQLGLKNVETFAFIKDPLFIRDAEIIIEPLTPDGRPGKPTTFSFAGEDEARKDIAYRIDSNSVGGAWIFNISFGLIKQTVTGKYAHISESVRLTTSIVSPIIEAGFSKSEAFTGQRIPLAGKVTAGALSEADTASMPFTLTAFNETSGKTLDAKLNYNAQSGTFSATISIPECGKWKLKETPAGCGKIVSSADSALSVKDRTIRIFRIVNDQKCPVSEIVIAANERFLSESIIVQPDLAPSETAQVLLSYKATAREEHAVTFSVDGVENGQAKYDITGNVADKLLWLKLLFKKPPGQRENVGSIIVTCKVSDMEAPVIREVPVICIPAERWFPLWVLLTFSACAIFVIALLWWYLTLPQFAGQQLILQDGPVTLLRDMRVGKRHALGTDQLPSSVLFKLMRPKDSPKCAVRPQKNSAAFVDGIMIDSWTVLTHGCTISVQTVAGRQKFTYRYFDRPPTAQELEIPKAVSEATAEGAPSEESVSVLAEDKAPCEVTQTGSSTKPQGETAPRVGDEGEQEVPSAAPAEKPTKVPTETEREELSVEEELKEIFGHLFKEDQDQPA